MHCFRRILGNFLGFYLVWNQFGFGLFFVVEGLLDSFNRSLYKKFLGVLKQYYLYKMAEYDPLTPASPKHSPHKHSYRPKTHIEPYPKFIMDEMGQNRPRIKSSKRQVSSNLARNEAQRSVSPDLSLATAAQSKWQQMEHSLMSQNRNLQEQNKFLTNHIKTMFLKQKKYVSAVKKYKIQNQELRIFNKQLQSQLNMLTRHTLEEISRIESMIRNDRVNNLVEEEGNMMSRSSGLKSSTLGWQTQATVHHTLDQLKSKVCSIEPEMIISFGHFDQQFIKTQDQGLKRTHRCQNLREFAEDEAQTTPAVHYSQDLTSYLPQSLNLEKTSRNNRDSRMRRSRK